MPAVDCGIIVFSPYVTPVTLMPQYRDAGVVVVIDKNINGGTYFPTVYHLLN